MHRGRWQAQGGGAEASEPWSQAHPLPHRDGIALLHTLRMKLQPKDREIRRVCFDKARILCDRLAAIGGIEAPYSKTFTVRGDTEGRRVDLEVNAGKAFTP